MIYQDLDSKNLNNNNNNNQFFINPMEYNGIKNNYNEYEDKNKNKNNLLEDTENLDPILNLSIDYDYNYNYGFQKDEFDELANNDQENISLLSTSSSNKNNLNDIEKLNTLQDLDSNLHPNLDLNSSSDLNSNLYPNLDLDLNSNELDNFNQISSTNSISTATTPSTEIFNFAFDDSLKNGNKFDEYSLDYHSSTSNIIYSNKLKDKLRQKRNSLSMGTINHNSSKSISPISPRSRSFTTTNYYYNNNNNNIRLRDGIRYRSKSISNLSNHKLKNSFLSSPNNPFYKPPDILRRLSDSE